MIDVDNEPFKSLPHRFSLQRIGMVHGQVLLYPDYIDLHYNKGFILYKIDKYEKALEAFEKCLELGDKNSEHLVLNGVGSFKAQEYKNLCLEQLKKSNKN